jgi:glutathione S-transferase
MDLAQKAQWHLDFNGGAIPILETPEGDLIKESGIIAQLAVELGGDEGVALIPKDPFQAA